ncbi:MAG TPA: sulfotransferase domain-containing protein [Acidimicrobiales bacterium]|nr:sulfotransferase domain-containing protein [Acidimicrobiales bacterium]
MPVRRPPVLVLGMPRSGTTWVGRTLGDAPDAIYFNEPVSEVHVAEQGRATFFEVDPDNPPASYPWPARFAAAGVPAFGPATVAPLGLLARLGRRVVIKEVNPLAVEWYAQALDPILISIVRHPAAVAVSLHERGWGWDGIYEQRFLERTRPLLPDVPANFWARIGAVQGIACHRLDAALPAATASYEGLCRDPQSSFVDLFEVAGLTWTDDVARSLQASTHGDITRGADDPLGTTRNTAAMADAWRTRITGEQLADVRVGWDATNPTRYLDDADWEL